MPSPPQPRSSCRRRWPRRVPAADPAAASIAWPIGTGRTNAGCGSDRLGGRSADRSRRANAGGGAGGLIDRPADAGDRANAGGGADARGRGGADHGELALAR
jgi:hypothetical protein